jgi:hypothetical protein
MMRRLRVSLCDFVEKITRIEARPSGPLSPPVEPGLSARYCYSWRCYAQNRLPGNYQSACQTMGRLNACIY